MKVRNYIKYLLIKYQIEKCENSLLQEGVKEAYRRKKNIQFGLEGKAIVNIDIFENIYLNQDETGKINIFPILALGIEKAPEKAERYFDYLKILKELKN